MAGLQNMGRKIKNILDRNEQEEKGMGKLFYQRIAILTTCLFLYLSFHYQ
jgi:hypothetical protein